MAEKTIKVTGMTCNHCKFSVEKNVGALAGISSIDVDLNGGQVKLHGENINMNDVEKTIKEIGFEYEGEIA